MIDISQARRDDLHTDLLNRVAGGDYTAFAALYFDLYRRVHGYAKMLLTDAADAKEVADAVFVEVWHTARLFTRDGTEGQTVLRWAMAIARRRCLKRPRQALGQHMRLVSPERHLTCQLGLLLAAAGARQPATCRCLEG